MLYFPLFKGREHDQLGEGTRPVVGGSTVCQYVQGTAPPAASATAQGTYTSYSSFGLPENITLKDRCLPTKPSFQPDPPHSAPQRDTHGHFTLRSPRQQLSPPHCLLTDAPSSKKYLSRALLPINDDNIRPFTQPLTSHTRSDYFDVLANNGLLPTQRATGDRQALQAVHRQLPRMADEDRGTARSRASGTSS
jgi:hypothetical protein